MILNVQYIQVIKKNQQIKRAAYQLLLQSNMSFHLTKISDFLKYSESTIALIRELALDKSLFLKLYTSLLKVTVKLLIPLLTNIADTLVPYLPMLNKLLKMLF